MPTPLSSIPLDDLHAHPANSNVMPPALLEKLAAHIRRSGQYPPVIVRPHPSHNGYQILDGHHRVAALRQLGESAANCLVWNVDDEQALVLLATLNRLQGRDDPHRRAALVADLSQRLDLETLQAQLPEALAELQKLLKLHEPPPAPRAPQPLAEMPVPVHFFLLPDQRTALERRLRRLGGSREQALMQLVHEGTDA